MSFASAVAQVAPLYNLGLAIIMLVLFIKLFQTNKTKQFLFPWKLCFMAVIVYLIEEGLTITRRFMEIGIPEQINGFFELVIVTLFIYMLLVQKEHMKKKK